jgi:hypothetical protein
MLDKRKAGRRGREGGESGRNNPYSRIDSHSANIGTNTSSGARSKERLYLKEKSHFQDPKTLQHLKNAQQLIST